MSDLSITQLLDRWKQGDHSVEDALITRLYPLLRDMAGQQLRRQDNRPTLGTTDLAHAAYERLRLQQHVDWQNRQHFFAITATIVRRVMIDYVRQRQAEKRGGEVVFVDIDTLHEADQPQYGGLVDWIALDQALERLDADDPACARVVELRLFGGLSIEEIAAETAVSVATVGRQWRFARTWLAEQLEQPG